MDFHAKYENYSQKDETKRNLNNFFIFSEGTLEVAMVSSDLIELPSGSELVSALWQVTVSAGAKVLVGISHCMKLSVKSVCHIGMVVGQREGREAVQLAYNEDASFFLQKDYGTLEVPVGNDPATYIIGIVKHGNDKPSTRSILSLFSSSTSVCQYAYMVYFEQRRQDSDVNCNMHWRVHILSYINICGLRVRNLALFGCLV